MTEAVAMAGAGAASKSAVRALLLDATRLHDPAEGRSHADFGAWCAAHPGQGCELWVSSSALADLVCEAGAPLRAAEARSAWAQRVLQHYHGDAAAQWALLPWRRGAALGVSALRQPALQALQAQAAPHRVLLRAVRPLWPLLLERLLAAKPALRRAAVAQAWLVEGGAGDALLTRIALAGGQVLSVHRRRLGLPWTTALQRVLDEDTASGAAGIALLCLDAPADGPLPAPLEPALYLQARELLPRRGSGPDFLRPQPRPGALAWCWLATAAVVLVAAAWDTQQAWQLRQQAAQLVRPAPPARVVVAVPTVDRAQAALRRRLAHPWPEVFLASEAPVAAGLRWVALDHQAGGELRLQGVAPDSAPVQQLAAHLRRQPAWQRVLVSRLEVQPEGQAFEIVARLAGAAP